MPFKDRNTLIIPGALRTRDVRVGQHIGISPGALPRFLDRFEQSYGGLGKAETIIVAALAEQGVIVSKSTRAPLRLASPARLASRWMPGLFPEQP